MDEPPIDEQQTAERTRAHFREFLIAGLFLTRLPFRISGELHSADLARAVWAFPLTGLLVGGCAGAVLMGASALHLHPLACAVLALAAAALVTGALHEDGLADTVDGFGGGHSRDDKLRIMRDSHIGTYGVLALLFNVSLRASIIAGLLGPGMAAAALVGAAVLSRSLLPVLMHLMPRARVDGLAAGAGRPSLARALVALLLGGLLAWPFLGLGVGPVAIGAAALTTLGIALIAHRQIGGYTGDVLGAAQQLAEISILVTAGAFAL